MPRKPAGPCRVQGCPGRDAGGGYCEEHQGLRPKPKPHKWEPEYNRRYNGYWRKLREQYILAHPLCEECLKQGIAKPATEVHHRVPLSEGGKHTIDNLESLCKSCHSRLHGFTGSVKVDH